MSIEKPDYSKEGIRRSAMEALRKISGRSDELPTKKLTIDNPKFEYKCTNNSFAAVAFWLDHLIDKEVIIVKYPFFQQLVLPQWAEKSD